MSKNNITKKIWLVTTQEEQEFVVIATTPTDCTDIIEELYYDYSLIFDKIIKIGNITPTSEYFNRWEGESKIVMSSI